MDSQENESGFLNENKGSDKFVERQKLYLDQHKFCFNI